MPFTEMPQYAVQSPTLGRARNMDSGNCQLDFGQTSDRIKLS